MTESGSTRLFENTRRRLSSFSLPFSPNGIRSNSLSEGEIVTEPEIINPISLIPPSHRENLALHALRDSIILPKLPKLPSISFHSIIHPATSVFKASNNSTTSSPTDSNEIPLESNAGNSESSYSKLTGNILVLGGYRGSLLRQASNGKRVWLPLKVGLGMRKVDLSIGLSDEDELNTVETIVPGKMMMSVGGVIDLGKRLKNHLKGLESSGADSKDGVKFHSWGYDWRRSLELSSAELLKYLEKLKEDSAEGDDFAGTTIIAHSMGGLVALYALSQATDTKLFKGIIFAGSPFRGCINVLSPFRRGDNVLFNSEICSPRAVFSMRSSFYFLPPSPNNSICFEDPNGTPIPVDLLDPISWSTHSLSPVTGSIFDEPSLIKDQQRVISRQEMESTDNHFDLTTIFNRKVTIPTEIEPNLAERNGNLILSDDEEESSEEDEVRKPNSENSTPIPRTSSPSDAVIAEYLVRMLDRVQKFHKTLETSYDPTKSYPPIVLLTASNTPTVRGSIVSSLEEISSDSTYSSLLFGEGDGIVLHESTKLPGEWGKICKGEVNSMNGHGSLLSDLNAIEECLELLGQKGALSSIAEVI